ncbi:hypothetical protein MAM1_0184c07472 [Mucor ambiguus]|uniref:Uncharacterized protein n=1 Tax=Mucor ambiguus TaxID=91626 RepID=A0A0C9MWM9_9FUNG|nr:hypothetical protein MAM1_0184c07472 [Mucor ambiguus]
MSRYQHTYPPSFNRLYDYITNENGRLGFKYEKVLDDFMSQTRHYREFDGRKYVQTCNDFLDDANSVLDYCQWCLEQLPQKDCQQPKENQSKEARNLWQEYISLLDSQTSSISYIRNECWKTTFRPDRNHTLRLRNFATASQSAFNSYLKSLHSLRYYKQMEEPAKKEAPRYS